MLSAHSLYALAKAIQSARLEEAEAARRGVAMKRSRRVTEQAIIAQGGAVEKVDEPAHRKIA